MMTIKESKKRLFKIKGMTIFDKYLAYNIVCEIHDSVGTCEQCKHYGDGLCFLNATYNYQADIRESDDFCKYFERKEK